MYLLRCLFKNSLSYVDVFVLLGAVSAVTAGYSILPVGIVVFLTAILSGIIQSNICRSDNDD